MENSTRGFWYAGSGGSKVREIPLPVDTSNMLGPLLELDFGYVLVWEQRYVTFSRSSLYACCVT